MRLVIDMQGAQHALRAGNPASFELQLAHAIVRHRGAREIVLLLSALYPDTIDAIRSMFHDDLEQACIHVWHTLPVTEDGPGVQRWPFDCAVAIKTAAIAGLRPDVVVLPVTRADAASAPQRMLRWSQRMLVVAAEPGAITSAAECATNDDALPALVCITAAQVSALVAGTGTDCDAAREAIASLWSAAEALQRDHARRSRSAPPAGQRPKLAYISPLPPEHSGISDYSAALIPALAQWYDIDLVAAQQEVSDKWLATHCRLLSPGAFLAQQASYDRILYHFGNSIYHEYMFELLEAAPGVVVLHDFFLGDLQRIRDDRRIAPHAWERALYAGHGYGAVLERYRSADELPVLTTYPSNVEVLRGATGVIVHSEYARRLAQEFYGDRFAAELEVIPLLRTVPPPGERAAARERLGIAPGDFIVCSAGFVAVAKQHHRILAGWQRAALSRRPESRLVFVGAAVQEYAERLEREISACGLQNVRITGRVDAQTYNDWLVAADLAVQLRMQSRGETSAAALDCMSHGLATIVNANGSMADLPSDSVEHLPDDFSDAQLAAALDALWADAERRRRIGACARALIEREHTPERCAAQYAQVIEHCAARAATSLPALSKMLGTVAGPELTPEELGRLAVDVARSVPVRPALRQLLIDVSAIARTDLKTGIQRVVRALVWEFIKAPPRGYRVEPVVMSDHGARWHYRYARKWTCAALGIPDEWAQAEPAEYGPGDVLLVADFTPAHLRAGYESGLLQAMRDAGVSVNFTVYDLLPIWMPQMFPPGMRQNHEHWFGAGAAVADRVLCISRAVAEEVARYLELVRPQRRRPLQIEWFHLGADLEGSIPTTGVPAGADELLAALAARPSFLMVGTVEPRKGHADVLAGFEQLWAGGADLNLVVVGKHGWMVDALCNRMRSHPEASRRLFWIEGASDEYLQRIYQVSRCLIAASEGEGFGLPLIEAAQHGIPVIARDIPVFREVAGEHATYFSGAGDAVASCVQAWLRQWDAGQAPGSEGMPWLTWRQSADRVLQCLGLRPAAQDLKPEASQEPVAGAR